MDLKSRVNSFVLSLRVEWTNEHKKPSHEWFIHPAMAKREGQFSTESYLVSIRSTADTKIRGSTSNVENGDTRLYFHFYVREKTKDGLRFVQSLFATAIGTINETMKGQKAGLPIRSIQFLEIGWLSVKWEWSLPLLISRSERKLHSSDPFDEVCGFYKSQFDKFLEPLGESSARYATKECVPNLTRIVSVPVHGIEHMPMCFFFLYALTASFPSDMSGFFRNILQLVLFRHGVNEVDSWNESRSHEIIGDLFRFLPQELATTPDRHGDNFFVAWASPYLESAQLDCEDLSLMTGLIYELFMHHTPPSAFKGIKAVLNKFDFVYCLVTGQSRVCRPSKSHTFRYNKGTHLVPLFISKGWEGSNMSPHVILLESMGAVECCASYRSPFFPTQTREAEFLDMGLKPFYTQSQACDMVYIDLIRCFRVDQGFVTELVPVFKNRIGLSFRAFLNGERGACQFIAPVTLSSPQKETVIKRLRDVPWESNLWYKQRNVNFMKALSKMADSHQRLSNKIEFYNYTGFKSAGELQSKLREMIKRSNSMSTTNRISLVFVSTLPIYISEDLYTVVVCYKIEVK